MTYIAAFLIISLLILVHELGHFVAALLLKIPVARFSIGFGPRIWGFERKGVEYRISWIPLGGYVLPAIKNLDEYFKIPTTKRILFSLGGPAANLLLPLPLFMALNVLTGGFSLEGIFVRPFVQTFEMSVQILASIPALFSGASAVSGPVGIVSLGGRFIGYSLARAATFASVLSLNFAVFNLLPVPVLDGGKILLALLQRVHPKAEKAVLPVTVASIVLLVLLLGYATVLDFSRIAGA